MTVEDLKKRQLGRGLSALFGDQGGETTSVAALAAQAGGRSLRLIPIAQIRPSRVQPRRHFAPAQLEELASSIREQGVLQPILVRRDPDHAGDYELIAGERRWRAAQVAQLHEIPAVIQDLSGAALLEAALVENIQDLQIQYGVSNDLSAAPAKVAYYAKAVDAAMDSVIAVRLCVLVASADEVMDEKTDYYNCQDTKVTPGDKRMYRSFRSTVLLPNRLGAV